MIGQLLTGRYLLLEKLGVGGFSETYLARDKYLPRHPLCVVKCLNLSPQNPLSLENAQRLFETEAWLLEQLGRHHTQIPTLLAYCQEQDPIYMVQEYIEGENLAAWLARGKRLPPNGAIALLLELLPILDYIHSQRVVHRDITPSNLIRRQRDGRFVLIDFGAACILSETETGPQPDPSDTPMAIGTPGYMPIEQCQGMSYCNSDIYALGSLVIHLLTGIHPKELTLDPVSGELDWHRYLPNRSIDPKLIEVLDRMVRCRVRDRYQQATDVLADLQTLPVTVRFRQRIDMTDWRKAMRRILLPATTAALLIGMMGGRYAPNLLKQTKPMLDELEDRLERSDVHITMLREIPVPNGVERMIISPRSRVLIIAGSDHTLRLWALPAGTMLKSLPGHTATITTLAISQDDKLLVSGSEDGSLRIWDLESGQLLRTIKGHQQPITTVAISPDERTLISGCKDGTLRRWDLQTGIRMQTFQIANAELTAAVYGATPDTLVSASSTRDSNDLSGYQLQVWNLQSGKIHRTFTGHAGAIVGLHLADDRTLFSFGEDRGLVWDLQREELATTLPGDSANPVTISCLGKTIVTVHRDGKIRVWSYKSRRLITKEESMLGQNLDVALSADHRYLASWSADQRLRIWQMTAKHL